MTGGEKDCRPGWVIARDEGKELTWQQQLAERTNGVVRLPNLMTATGIGLTILSARYASQNRPIAASAAAAAGFAMDMEGSVARRFGVEDPASGAKIDQTADITKAAIVAGTLLSHDVMPGDAAVLTYGPKLVGLAAGIVAKTTGDTTIPSSKVGKVAEVCRDIVPVAFLGAAVGRKLDKPWLERASKGIAWGAVGGAAIVGAVAAAGYLREAVAAKKFADLSAHPAETLDHAENQPSTHSL